MAKIQGIWAREIINSSGKPAIECTLWLDNGGIVASEVTTDEEINNFFPTDHDQNKFQGDGLQSLCGFINSQLAPSLVGQDPTNQENIDIFLNSNIKQLKRGGSLVVSQAVLKAGALTSQLPTYAYIQKKYQLAPQLKIPAAIYTIIGGGEFSTHNLDIQEFQIIAATHLDFPQSLSMASTIFSQLQKILSAKKAVPAVNSMGALTPNLYGNNDAFELILEAVKTTQYVHSQDFFFGVNVMAGNLFSNGKYQFKERQEGYLPDELLIYYRKIQETYQILCLQNPFTDNDKKLATAMMTEMGQIMKIGGEIAPAHIHKIIDQKIYNIVIVKPNLFSTISDLIKHVQTLKNGGLATIIAQSFYETNDDLPADISVGVGAEYVQFGPTNRGERVAKYNRLLVINDELKRAK